MSALSNKCHASSNRCLTSSNKKHLVTIKLLVTSALRGCGLPCPHRGSESHDCSKAAALLHVSPNSGVKLQQGLEAILMPGDHTWLAA